MISSIFEAGLNSILSGTAKGEESAESIAKNGVEGSDQFVEDAVNLAIGKRQVQAGVSIIKSGESMYAEIMKILDE